MDGAERELEEMENQEGEDDGPAPHHSARRVGGRDVGFLDVGNRASFLLKEPQLEGRPDMKNDGDEKSDTSAPQRAGVGFQEFRVVIDFLGRLVDLEIAKQVADDETEENDTGDSHDGFLADGGLPKTKRAGRKWNGRSAHGINQSLLLLRIVPRKKNCES